MSVQETREQLIQQRDSLKTKLNEVQEQLDKLDVEINGGKMKKAIVLLKECNDYLGYPTVPLECCPECQRPIDIGFYEIIEGLETLLREEF